MLLSSPAVLALSVYSAGACGGGGGREQGYGSRHSEHPLTELFKTISFSLLTPAGPKDGGQIDSWMERLRLSAPVLRADGVVGEAVLFSSDSQGW